MRSSPDSFDSSSLDFIAAVEINFDSEDVRLWTGYTDLTIEGEVYTGAANLITISGFNESQEIAAKGATVTLSGLDASIISYALQENYQNRPLRIMVGTLDSGVPNVYTIFRGRMDVMEITEVGDTANLAISAENRLIDLDRARSSRYTSEDQKSYYPGDLGLDYVASLQDRQIDWGK